MQLVNLWVFLNKTDHVFKKAVTPAEAQVLVHQFQKLAGKFPLQDIKVTGVAQSVGGVAEDGNPAKLKARTAAEEVSRLRKKYSDALIKELFPGANPKVPETMEEAFPAVAKDTAEPEALGACVDEPGEASETEKAG